MISLFSQQNEDYGRVIFLTSVFRLVLTVHLRSIIKCNYGVRFDGPYGVDYMLEGLTKEVQKRMERSV